MFLDYKFAYSTDSESTELLDVFSPSDALHIKYPITPISIYATKQEIDLYQYRFDSHDRDWRSTGNDGGS